MNPDPAARVATALRGMGIFKYDLTWQTTAAGKPFDFRLTVGDSTFRASTVRAIIRAARRQFLT